LSEERGRERRGLWDTGGLSTVTLIFSLPSPLFSLPDTGNSLQLKIRMLGVAPFCFGFFVHPGLGFVFLTQPGISFSLFLELQEKM
jgi:hypothetical protein